MAKTKDTARKRKRGKASKAQRVWRHARTAGIKTIDEDGASTSHQGDTTKGREDGENDNPSIEDGICKSDAVDFDHNLSEAINEENTVASSRDDLEKCGTHDQWPTPDTPPPLSVETTPQTDSVQGNKSLSGNRLVNIVHLCKQFEHMENQTKEHRQKCTYGKYQFDHEERNGMVSTLVHKCVQCNAEYKITTHPTDKAESVNDAAVWGAMAVGIGHSQFEEMFAVMNTPVMNAKKFRRHEVKVGKGWLFHLTDKMKRAGELERRLAIERGDIVNGVPFITVIVDGGWSKRSYGHSFSAASGVVVIIGAHTNKILYLGVKNKYCLTCARSKTANIDTPKHICYLNFKGSSTSMEQQAIVEGFKCSMEQHGVIYKYMVGDGDSSVFVRVQTCVAKYGRTVEKRECANHVVRCYRQNLQKICSNTKLYELEARKFLKPLIVRISKGARAAIRNCAMNAAVLKEDLLNGPLHVFGSHGNCKDNYCSRKDSIEPNLVPLVENTKVWKEVQRLADGLSRKADQLKHNITTNQAERLMGLVAKFTGGKRVNFTTGGGYERRCVGAGLAHTSGPNWHLSPWKSMTNTSPGSVFKTVVGRRGERNKSRRTLFDKNGPPLKRRKTANESSGPDMDYGSDAAQPDITDEEMVLRKAAFLAELQRNVATPELCAKLERATVGQAENPLWRESRRNIITASKMSQIFKRRPHTSCHNKVRNILYARNVDLSSKKEVAYGIANEKNAIGCYEIARDVQVDDCGLFIQPQLPYLGASPDGLVGEDGLVEVKCLPSIGGLHPREAAAQKNNICVTLVDGNLTIKPRHDYWIQIQAQLAIANRRYCDLLLYSDGGFDAVRIERDTKFWEDELLPKLKTFFYECMLPEIIDGRIPRGMPVREPPFIQQAIDEWAARHAPKH